MAKRRGGTANNRVPVPDKVEEAFDHWLSRGLHELYDPVVGEAIPDSLLRLIEADRRLQRDLNKLGTSGAGSGETGAGAADGASGRSGGTDKH